MKASVLNIFLGLFILSQIWVGVASYLPIFENEETELMELLNAEEKESEKNESEEKESEEKESEEKEKSKKIRQDNIWNFSADMLLKSTNMAAFNILNSPTKEIHLPPPEFNC